MPEAVIVATARSPIGRANKGSLVDCRPDDLAAQIVEAVARQGARSSTRNDVEDLMLGMRPAGGRAGLQHRPASSPSSPGMRRRARHHRQPLLLVVAADDPHGRPRDQGGRGRRVHRRRRRDASAAISPVRPTAATATAMFDAAMAGRTERARGRAGRRGRRPRVCPTSTSRWVRPRRTCAKLEGRDAARRWTSSAPARSSGRSSRSRTGSSSARSRR